VFPLAGKQFPRTPDELSGSIRDALSEVLTIPKNGSAVVVDAPKFPTVKKMKVDLDGASVRAATPPPPPKPTGKREPGITVSQLEVTARPIKYEASKVNVQLKGSGLEFDFAKDKKGAPILVLTDAEDGNVDLNIDKADIKSLALAAASMAAKEQGVTIKDVEVNLRSEGKRSVAADVRVNAKKMMVSGAVHLKGKLDVDDELNATLSDLECTGEGVVGSIVSKFVQPKIKPYNGRKIPLVTFSLGDVSLRDLKIDAKNGLHVTARFGKNA